MKYTKLQSYLKKRGIAARRFKILTDEEKTKIDNPDHYDVYQSELFYSPWSGDPDFLEYFQKVRAHSLVDGARCWVLYCGIRQALHLNGEIWECGVYKGGTALMIRMLRDKFACETLVRLFDSFSGMPDTDKQLDVHKSGDFSDTSLEAVETLVGKSRIQYHAGFIPDTFQDLNVDSISFAHVDLDLHDAILESCKFVYPRLQRGGVLIFDDYGFPSCPGAKIAVDNFFSDKVEYPMVLPTGQAVVHKL